MNCPRGTRIQGTMKRRAAKVDANQPQLVDQLRKAGYSVAITSQVGNGFPDIVVGFERPSGERVNVLVEIKDATKPPSAKRLTADEKAFHQKWQGRVVVVESVEEALEVLR